VTDGVPAVEGNNSGAATTDDTEASCHLSDFDVWFEYIATCTGSATVDSLGSGQADTALAIYDTCGGSEIACNDDTNGTLSEVSFNVITDQSRWIRLASISSPGDYNLNIRCVSDQPIPAVSEWGLIVMVLLLLTTGTLAWADVASRRTKPKT